MDTKLIIVFVVVCILTLIILLYKYKNASTQPAVPNLPDMPIDSPIDTPDKPPISVEEELPEAPPPVYIPPQEEQTLPQIPQIPESAKFKYWNCYKNPKTGNIFPILYPDYSIQQCADEAKKQGYKIFGLTNYGNGEKNMETIHTTALCGIGNDMKYTATGLANECVNYKPGDYFGLANATAIYKLE